MDVDKFLEALPYFILPALEFLALWIYEKYLPCGILMKEEYVRVHEAGHLLAVIKSSKDKSNAYNRHLSGKLLVCCSGSKCGYVTYRNYKGISDARVSLSGVAADYYMRGKRMTRWNLWLEKWFGGSFSDIVKTKYNHRMSPKEMVALSNRLIDEYTEQDRRFIMTVCEMLAGRPKSKLKNTKVPVHSLTRKELYKLSRTYYKEYQSRTSTVNNT